MHHRRLHALLLLSLGLVACSPKSGDKAANDGWKAKLPNADKLVYRFRDASVPPPAHRSFTITVTPSSVEKIVDSYGDIVSERKNPITAQQFRSLLDKLEQLGIGATTAKTSEPGCTGGTGESVELYVGESQIFSASADYCGGKRSGDLQGDAKALATAAEALLAPEAADSKPTPERFSREQIETMIERLKACVDEDSGLEAMAKCGCASDLELSSLPAPADPEAHCTAYAKAVVELAALDEGEQVKAAVTRAADDVPAPGSLGLFSFAVPCLMEAIEAKSEPRLHQCICATHYVANEMAAASPKTNDDAETAMGEAARKLASSGACKAPH